MPQLLQAEPLKQIIYRFVMYLLAVQSTWIYPIAVRARERLIFIIYKVVLLVRQLIAHWGMHVEKITGKRNAH